MKDEHTQHFHPIFCNVVIIHIAHALIKMFDLSWLYFSSFASDNCSFSIPLTLLLDAVSIEI